MLYGFVLKEITQFIIISRSSYIFRGGVVYKTVSIMETFTDA